MQIPKVKRKTAKFSLFLIISHFALLIFILLPQSVEAGVIRKPMDNRGLVGYWSFNEGANGGTKAGDSSGNGNDAILGISLTRVDGIRGKAVEFPAGVNNHIAIGTPTQLAFGASQSFTISLWQRSAVLANRRGLVSKVASGTQYIVLENNGSNPRFSIGSGGAETVVQSSVSIDTGWHLITAVRDVTADTHYIYVDGLQRGSATDGTSGSEWNNSANWKFGEDEEGFANFHTGQIDDVRIYNRALSASEVKTLYQSGSARIKAPTNNGLVGYWSMNEGTGNRADDSSGNRNHGTLTNGPVWTNGKLGKALNFDGSNDYVTVPDAPSLDITSFTVALWMKASNTSQTSRYLLSKLNDAATSNVYSILYGYGSAGLVRWFASGSTYGHTLSNSDITIPDTNWHHIAYTYDGITYRKFLDGLEGTPNTIASPLEVSTGALVFASFNGSQNFFDGSIDDVRIYNRALAPSEVEGLYRSGSARIKAPTNNGLVGYWSMNEGTGNRADDSSGNRNHGTLTNGPAWVDGKKGKALNFDGSDDFVRQDEYSSSLDLLGTNLTLSAWVKPRDFGGWQTIVTRPRFDTTHTSPYFEWSMIIENSLGRLTFFDIAQFDHRVSVTALVPNVWSHVAITLDPSNNLRHYINGQLDNTTASTHSVVNTNSTRIRIGSNGGGGEVMRGLIDDVRIYNRALSADEVKTLYESR